LRWPFIIYRGAVDFGDGHDPAAVMEDLFEANSWGDTWRDGIYSYVHYHSRIHEVLGIARGKGRVRFGGNKGRIFTLKAGDVAILPAGTGHQVEDRPRAPKGSRPAEIDLKCRRMSRLHPSPGWPS
jgi:uncharacterized protein YjlB